MNDQDIVAIQVENFVTNDPDRVEAILNDESLRKKVLPVSRATMRAMYRVFEDQKYVPFIDAPALVLEVGRGK